MKSKRAVVEVQFNWIFVIVAGALILLFFMMIVTKQKEISNKKLAYELLTDLELIIAGQGVSIGRSDVIKLPEVDMEVTCDHYSIAGIERRTGNSIMFSPSKIEGEQLIAWTLDWSLPYRVSNFIYLTSTDMKYYIIYEPGEYENLANEIKDSLPKELNVDMYRYDLLNNILYERNYKVRFIFIGTQTEPGMIPNAFKSLSDERVSAIYVHITGEAEDLTYLGDVEFRFFKKREGWFVTEHGSPEEVYECFDKPMMYGALFTDNLVLFDCNLMKGLKRYQLVSQIYTNRSLDLSNSVSVNCLPFFQAAPFGDVVTSVKALRNGSEADLSYNIITIKSLNDNAILNSCPTLY